MAMHSAATPEGASLNMKTWPQKLRREFGQRHPLQPTPEARIATGPGPDPLDRRSASADPPPRRLAV